MGRATALPDLPEELILTELTQLEALANPTRMRVLLEASQPTTVAAVADRLGIPKTRLYYHVNLLVDAGLLTQVDERKSGARIERIYRVAARNLRPGTDVWNQAADQRHAADLAAGVIFEPARAETAAVLEQRGGDLAPIADFGRWLAYLTEEQATNVAGRIKRLLDGLGDTAPRSGTQPYALTYAFVPTDLPDAGP